MNWYKIINSIVWLALLGVAFYLGLQRVDIFLKLKAMGDCGQESHYTVVDKTSGATITYPAAELYKKCLKDKSY